MAVVLGNMDYGGVESVVMNYYRHLDHNKVQFDFYVHENSTNLHIEEITNLGGRIFLIPNYVHVIKYCKTLYYYFKRYQYRIVHVHLNTMSLFAQFSAWLAGIPVRITHNHSTAGKGETKRNVMKYTLRMFSNWFITDRCACSKYAGAWMWGKKKLIDGEIKVWPNAIDLPKFRFDQNIRDKVRSKYHIEDKFVIGHVGRFMKQKNHRYLIEVFYELQKRRNDAVLMLVGDGELEYEIQELVDKLQIEDKVIFAGTTDEPWAFYSAFDVFVLPSLYEGLGMVGIEAQVSGLPCYFSNNVPREIRMSKAKFLPIDKGTKLWVSELENVVTDTDSRYGFTDKKLNYFDINIEGDKMTEWYMDLKKRKTC